MNSFTSARNKVLAAKHTASLQLLCTVGGNQARSDAHSEFEILERSPKGGGEVNLQTGNVTVRPSSGLSPLGPRAHARLGQISTLPPKTSPFLRKVSKILYAA